jgi:hypothetical protein
MSVSIPFAYKWLKSRVGCHLIQPAALADKELFTQVPGSREFSEVEARTLYEGVAPVLALPWINPASSPAMVVTTVSKVCKLVDTPHTTAPQSVRAAAAKTKAKVPTVINHIQFVTPCVGSSTEATSR